MTNGARLMHRLLPIGLLVVTAWGRTTWAQSAPWGRGALGVKVVTDSSHGPEGARIFSVVERGPADMAQLRAGDLVVSMNGQRIRRGADLPAQLAGTHVGDTVRLVVRSGRDERTIAVSLAAPQPFGGGECMYGRVWDGLWQSRTTPDPRWYISGMGAAQKAAGLALRDVITSIDGQAVASPREDDSLLFRHYPGDTVSLGVRRGDRDLTVSLPLGCAVDIGDGRGFAQAIAQWRQLVKKPELPQAAERHRALAERALRENDFYEWKAQLPPGVKASSPFGNYEATYTQLGDELVITRKTVGATGIYAPDKIKDLVALFREVGKDDASFIVIKK